MYKQRYLIVEYSIEDEAKYRKNPVGLDGKFQNYLHIHHMLGTYHWSRLDSQHVVLLANYSVHHHKALQEDHKVSLLPHISSAKPIHKVVKKSIHWEALRDKLEVDHDSSMDDILDALEEKHGAIFAPIR